MRRSSYGKSLLDDLPQLLGQDVAGVFNRKISPLVHNLLSSVGALGVSPSRVCPPLLDSLDLILEFLFFVVCHDVGVGYDLLNLSNYLFQTVRQFDCVLLGMIWEMVQVAKKRIVGRI